MQKLKKFLKYFIPFFVLPSLFMHELSHYVMAYLMFEKPQRLKIKISFSQLPSGYVDCDKSLFENPSKQFKCFIISLAPLLTMILFAVLSFFSHVCLFIFIYQLISFYWSFLSNVDLNRCLKCLGNTKEVSFPNAVWLINWLYYDGLTEKEHLEKIGMAWLYIPKSEKEFLKMFPKAKQTENQI